MTNQLLKKKSSGQKHDLLDEAHLHNIIIDTREIFLHGEPGVDGEDSGVDYRVGMKFLKNMRILEQSGDGPIIIYQHGIGGLVDVGLLIYDTIHNSPCQIIFVVCGTACSISTLILQAADVRVATPNCSFLIHGGQTGIYGLSHKESQSWAEIEQKQYEMMLDIYTQAIMGGNFFVSNNMDDKKVKKFISTKLDQKSDWWLLADQALEFGFLDGILNTRGWENIEIIKNRIENG
jgi:ATP-dependent protease ClpP protease subunit